MKVDVSNMVLPHDIMFDILLLLPAKSLVQFVFVSKSWYRLIRDPFFTNMHLNKHNNYKAGQLIIRVSNRRNGFHILDNFQESDDEMGRFFEIKKPIFRVRDSDEKEIWCEEIWGSCNGLICIQLVCTGDSPLYIWNPTTMEYRKIPSVKKHPLSTGTTYGFGYHDNDYVILKITRVKDHLKYRSEVDVYSLGENLWTTLPGIPYEIIHMIDEFGVPCNGAFHWIAARSEDTMRGPGYHKLIAYNPRRKECIEIPAPDLTMYYYSTVFEYKGKLCVLHSKDLWVMSEYGVRDSWTKLLNISEEAIHVAQMYPNCSTECGYIAMKCLDGTISFYNPKKKKSASKIKVGHYVWNVIYCAENIAAVNIKI